MTEPLLEVGNLTIEQTVSGARVLCNVDLTVTRGEVLAVIGESGSGKTTLALAALGHIRSGLRVASGSMRLDGVDLLALEPEALRQVRGRRVAYVAQSAKASFNPALTVGAQVVEPALVHNLMSMAQARTRAVDLYGEMGLPNPGQIGLRYPHQVSGGQLQRLMAAMAMSCGPDLLVLDEPTTALDVTTQIAVLEAFKRAIRKRGAAAIYISHDLAVVAQIADRILVLRHGQIQEQGDCNTIITLPSASYTQTLMAACKRWVPGSIDSRPAVAAEPLLEVSQVSAGYGREKRGVPRVLAANSIDLVVPRASVLGIIGESGSGKSTVARVIAGLLPPLSGTIRLGGEVLPQSVGLRSRQALRRIQIVFQSPDVALNPAQTVEQILGRPLTLFRGLRGRERTQQIKELLEMVQLPSEFASRRPEQLSGGEKQRVNLARALAAQPDLILCDEVTSALDTVVAASVIDLLGRLRAEHGIAFVMITHDISMVATFADQLAVMHRGEIVERGATDRVLNQPQNPYTKILVDSVPQLRRGWLESAIAARAQVLKDAADVALID